MATGTFQSTDEVTFDIDTTGYFHQFDKIVVILNHHKKNNNFGFYAKFSTIPVDLSTATIVDGVVAGTSSDDKGEIYFQIYGQKRYVIWAVGAITANLPS